MKDQLDLKSTYFWWQEFTREQVEKVNRVDRRRHTLDPNLANEARFCQRQLGKSEAKTVNFWGSWEGGPEETIWLNLIPLMDAYAECLYGNALRALRKRMPHFDEHICVDGDRLGERRLIFPRQEEELASAWLSTRMWKLAENPELTVGESVRTFHRKVSWSSKPERVVHVMIHCEEVTREHAEDAKQRVIDGLSPLESPAVRKRFPWEQVRETLSDLSHPELVLLNWEELRKPEGPLEVALWEAINKPDIDGIRKALKSGANLNHLDRFGHTPLASLIMDYGNLWHNADHLDERRDISHYPSLEQLLELAHLFLAHGADVNLAGPEEDSAFRIACLVADVRLVELLLDHGGRQDFRWASGYPGELSVWDAAWRRCDGMNETSHDESVEKLLESRFGTPYADVIPSDHSIEDW